MKTSLKLIALLIAAGYPVVALAEFAGISIPSTFTPEYVLGLFIAAFVSLIFFSDYSRRLRDYTVTSAPILTPPSSAFATVPAAQPERLAA